MTREEIISGLKFTVEMFLLDPMTGETYTEPRNDMDKTTIDACKGAIELLEQKPSVSENPNNCDLISRQEAIDAANKVIERDTSGNNDVVNAMIAWSAYIKSLPSVKPQEPTGHWIIIDDCEKFIAKCSECGQIEDSRMIGKYAYCHCGARMSENPTGSKPEISSFYGLRSYVGKGANE